MPVTALVQEELLNSGTVSIGGNVKLLRNTDKICSPVWVDELYRPSNSKKMPQAIDEARCIKVLDEFYVQCSHTHAGEYYGPPFALSMTTSGRSCHHCPWAKKDLHSSELGVSGYTIYWEVGHLLSLWFSPEFTACDTLMNDTTDMTLATNYPISSSMHITLCEMSSLVSHLLMMSSD